MGKWLVRLPSTPIRCTIVDMEQLGSGYGTVAQFNLRMQVAEHELTVNQCVLTRYANGCFAYPPTLEDGHTTSINWPTMFAAYVRDLAEEAYERLLAQE